MFPHLPHNGRQGRAGVGRARDSEGRGLTLIPLFRILSSAFGDGVRLRGNPNLLRVLPGLMTPTFVSFETKG